MSSAEMAAIFVSENGDPPPPPNVCIYPIGNQLRELHYLNSNRDPMVYPLIFPYGEQGFNYFFKIFIRVVN